MGSTLHWPRTGRTSPARVTVPKRRGPGGWLIPGLRVVRGEVCPRAGNETEKPTQAAEKVALHNGNSMRTGGYTAVGEQE